MTDPTRPDGTRSHEPGGSLESGSFVPEGGAPALTGALERRLRIVRKLGDGGMGTVWEVEHLLTKHRRALKILHGEQAGRPDVVERFLREASVAGKLQSIHVVETFDAGVLEDGRPFVLMELVPGKSLATLGDEHVGLEPDRVVRLLSLVCEGMIVAHDKGVIHRDLKPENVIVTPDDGVKILDFGISKFLEPEDVKASVTREGALIGTPHYMSPEQAIGRPVDARADVYAIGAMAYELLSGRLPYDAQRLPELLIRIHEAKHAALTDMAPHVSLALAAVVERAMHGDVEQRYASMKLLRDALAPFRDPRAARRDVKTGGADEHAMTVAGGPALRESGDAAISIAVDTPAGARPVSLDDDVTAPAPWTKKDDAARAHGRASPGALPAASVATSGPAPMAPRSRTGMWIALAVAVVAIASVGAWAWSHETSRPSSTVPPATLADIHVPPPPVTPPVTPPPVTPPPLVAPPPNPPQHPAAPHGTHAHDAIDRTNPYGP